MPAGRGVPHSLEMVLIFSLVVLPAHPDFMQQSDSSKPWCVRWDRAALVLGKFQLVMESITLGILTNLLSVRSVGMFHMYQVFVPRDNIWA
jgi:hypothetical protein